MDLPLTIDWARPLMLSCPYNECGNCYYVGREIQAYGQCPLCKHRFSNATGPWPKNQWFSAAQDLAFLYDHKRLELGTIAAAGYFEGCIHAFLWDGMYFIRDDTRWKPEQHNDQFEASQVNQVCTNKIDREFQKYRGWQRRAEKLCPKVFGAKFDELLSKYVSDHESFITNRDNIHKWRNHLLHRGFPLAEVFSEEAKQRMFRAIIEFMVECWVVFAKLQNELIAKIVAERESR